jgi:hypothetical protein
MADKKVTELTAITNLSGDDLLLVVNDPLGTPGSRKITVDNVFGNVATNASFTGDRVSVSANLYYQGSELNSMIDNKISVANAAVDTSNLWDGITETNTAIRAVVDTNAATELLHLANTNSRVDLVNTNLKSTNVAIRTLVDDRLQVANAESTYVKVTDLSVKATVPIVNATTNANTPIIKVSTATGIQGTVGSAPSSNNTATEGVPVGTIFFSNNHLYIATDATTIKRVSLEVFS